MSMLRLETRKIDDLDPAPYNPRTISDAALSGLRCSVERFGLVEPIVWNRRTGHVVGGHQRLKVLRAMGEIATQVVVVDLPGSEEKALNIALNNPAIAGEFTADIHTLLAEITATLPDLAAQLRFDDLAAQTSKLLADLTPQVGLTDPDSLPDAPESPVTNAGDLWLLGGHRLICGDSGCPETLAHLMQGNVAALYVTDPPYGVGYDDVKDNINPENAGLDGWDHFSGPEALTAFLTQIFRNALLHAAQDAAWYCWHAALTAPIFRKVWDDLGIHYHQTIIWVKPTHVMGFPVWYYRAEPCMLGWQRGRKPQIFPVPDEHSNCWQVDWEGKARCTDGQHPTQKPVRLFELPMLKHTRPGDICLETFCGSGSQIIAAERLGRRCYAVERNPRYCDVAVRRWEQYTGKKAERIPAGEAR